jgi:hypothetical protein
MADLGAPTDTIDKLVQLAGLDGRSGGPPAAPNDPALAWFSRIDERTLIIVDEAAMASTAGGIAAGAQRSDIDSPKGRGGTFTRSRLCGYAVGGSPWGQNTPDVDGTADRIIPSTL